MRWILSVVKYRCKKDANICDVSIDGHSGHMMVDDMKVAIAWAAPRCVVESICRVWFWHVWIMLFPFPNV